MWKESYKYYCTYCDDYFNIDIRSTNTTNFCPICGSELPKSDKDTLDG